MNKVRIIGYAQHTTLDSFVRNYFPPVLSIAVETERKNICMLYRVDQIILSGNRYNDEEF